MTRSLMLIVGASLLAFLTAACGSGEDPSRGDGAALDQAIAAAEAEVEAATVGEAPSLLLDAARFDAIRDALERGEAVAPHHYAFYAAYRCGIDDLREMDGCEETLLASYDAGTPVVIAVGLPQNVAETDDAAAPRASSGALVTVDGGTGVRFSGSIGSTGSQRSVTGTTPASFEIARSSAGGVEVYVAVIQKESGGGSRLVVTLQCGSYEERAATTTAYGAVSVTCTR